MAARGAEEHAAKAFHVGRLLPRWAGPLPPTGQVLDLRVIDVLTVTAGRITDIWMVADELGALIAVDAVRLPLPASADRPHIPDHGGPDAGAGIRSGVAARG